MFAVARSVVNRASRTGTSRILTRSFAEVVSAPSASSSSKQRPHNLSYILKEKVPVREDHGLYGFFRKKDNAAELSGEAQFEVFEDPQSRSKQTGRAWKASELRLKSFQDLHTLWYILLRERNLLATQKEESRRMGVQDPASQVSTRRTRKSMARIKYVLNERRLAYEGALQIVEAEREEKVNQEVLASMKGAWEHKVQHQKKRRAYLARRKELMLAKVAKKLEAASEAAKAKIPTPKTKSRIGGILVETP
ncbi:hypothetical protein H0H93_006151 [Arthromyces matolae]|nr:hypothetical protein H0H93_006151 [Arthromyces matolae]